MDKNFETISFNMETSDYENLLKISTENNTTIDEIIYNFLKLCIKEQGLVIWENDGNKPYNVLITKKEVQEYIKESEK